MSLAYHMLRAAVVGMSLPPLGLARTVGRTMGRLAFKLDERHRNIVMDNLAASFPEHDADWVAATAQACFEHIGMVVAEIPRLVRLPAERIAERTRFHGMDNLRQAKAKKRGVFLLTGHIGNWEWGAVSCGPSVPNVGLVARPIDWPPAEKLVSGWRSAPGHFVVPKNRSARQLLRHCRQGGVSALLLDQNVDWYDGEWVDFFGRPACSNKGLALLHMRTKAPVLTFHCWRGDDGMFDVHFGPELELIQSGDKTQDVWDNTQNYAKALEAIIRQKPAQWFWLHQRWKTRPYHNWPRGT